MPVKSDIADSVVCAATLLLESLFTRVGMPDSHGVAHCKQVLGHMDKALSCPDLSSEVKNQLIPRRVLALRLAALLHEADDHKYFKKEERNARTIMDEVLSSLDDANTIVEEVEQMISFVSASGNGNKVPEQAEGDPSLLWPRFCDRLEAIGTVGAVRCYQFNSEKGDPLMSKTTPRPTTEEELWAEVKEERFENYQKSGGGSASMMDHYYDKLLQIAVFPTDVVQCSYLTDEAQRRVKPLVEICLEASKRGEAPIDLIKSYI